MGSAVAPDRLVDSPVELTREQSLAIETRDVSVALSAGAGCGKTFVLTERFLSHLDPDRDGTANATELNELIAITFTERAAREMRDRIRLKCLQRLESADDRHAEHWLVLLRSLDSARVSTIHSFCGSLLRTYAIEARLDPTFTVLDETQADTLLAEVIEDGLRSRLVEKDETALKLVVDFGLERTRGMLTSLLQNRQEIDFESWTRETPESLVERWQEYHRRVFIPALLRKVADGDWARQVLNILRGHSVGGEMATRREILLSILPSLHESGRPKDDLARVREHARVQGSSAKRDWPTEEVYDTFKTAAEHLRSKVKEADQQLAFDTEAALADAEAGLNMLRLAGDMEASYEKKKRELIALDFDDLLLRAHRLLTDPAHEGLRRRLAANVRLLLVDEFQDTDPVQVEIVKALSGDLQAGKLFFVGDYKQSIYRFRGAQPNVFRRLQADTPAPGRLHLTKNFRSQPAILEFVNALFHETFTGEKPLVADRPQTTPTPAVEFLWYKTDESRNEAGAALRARHEEARWIARRLRGMIDRGEKLVVDQQSIAAGQPRLRAVRPGDIAILLRALSDVAQYEQALQAYGLDYYLVGGHAFYAQQEIYDMLNLLRALASPADEISLAGVLRSPMFSLADETLFWLAQPHGGLSRPLFSGRIPPEIIGQQRQRVEFAAATLSELRSLKDRVPVAELMNEALARTGYDATLIAEFLGERKLANLRKLVHQARNLDRSGVFTLSDFIVQLSQFVARQPREPLAATHPENTDVVRLMTVHQAKGLEFPVVVIPDIDRGGHGLTGGIAFSKELGPLVKLPDFTGAPPVLNGYEMHALVAGEEETEETWRLLYVATTRAADYLMLSSSVFDFEKPAGTWMKLLSSRFELQTGQLKGLLPPGYAVPQVRASGQEPQTDFVPRGRWSRADLDQLVADARRLAAEGKGRSAPLSLPVAADAAARRQYSFSRLTGSLHVRRPRLDDSEPAALDPPASNIDPLGLGTLVHAVLQAVHLNPRAKVRQLVERQAARQLIESAEITAEAVELVTRFLTSARWKQLGLARRSHAEIEFMLAWPPAGSDGEGLRLPPSIQRATPLYLQGVIDCIYQGDDDQWRLMDYKTNLVDAGGVSEAAQPYEMQLYVYALAAEQILGVAPAELVLHFLRPGAEHRFTWDDRARRRAVELVNQGIMQAVGGPPPVKPELAFKNRRRMDKMQQRLFQ